MTAGLPRQTRPSLTRWTRSTVVPLRISPSRVCREFIVLCRRRNLFTEATVAIDGSKFKAVNRRDRNFTSGEDGHSCGAH